MPLKSSMPLHRISRFWSVMWQTIW